MCMVCVYAYVHVCAVDVYEHIIRLYMVMRITIRMRISMRNFMVICVCLNGCV